MDLSLKILMSPLEIVSGIFATFYRYFLTDFSSLLLMYYKMEDLRSNFMLFYLFFTSLEFHRMMQIWNKSKITVQISNSEWNRMKVLYIFCITVLETLSSVLFIAIFSVTDKLLKSSFLGIDCSLTTLLRAFFIWPTLLLSKSVFQKLLKMRGPSTLKLFSLEGATLSSVQQGSHILTTKLWD